MICGRRRHRGQNGQDNGAAPHPPPTPCGPDTPSPSAPLGCLSVQDHYQGLKWAPGRCWHNPFPGSAHDCGRPGSFSGLQNRPSICVLLGDGVTPGDTQPSLSGAQHRVSASSWDPGRISPTESGRTSQNEGPWTSYRSTHFPRMPWTGLSSHHPWVVNSDGREHPWHPSCQASGFRTLGHQLWVAGHSGIHLSLLSSLP